MESKKRSSKMQAIRAEKKKKMREKVASLRMLYFVRKFEASSRGMILPEYSSKGCSENAKEAYEKCLREETSLLNTPQVDRSAFAHFFILWLNNNYEKLTADWIIESLDGCEDKVGLLDCFKNQSAVLRSTSVFPVLDGDKIEISDVTFLFAFLVACSMQKTMKPEADRIAFSFHLSVKSEDLTVADVADRLEGKVDIFFPIFGLSDACADSVQNGQDIQFSFVKEYSGLHRVYPPLSMVKQLSDKWLQYKIVDLSPYMLPQVVIERKDNWTNMATNAVYQLQKVIQDRSFWSEETKEYLISLTRIGLVAKAKHRLSRKDGVSVIKFAAGESVLDLKRDVVNIEPLLDDSYIEYRYVFNVFKRGSIKHEFLCRFKLTKEESVWWGDTLVESLGPRDKKTHLTFCDKIMDVLKGNVMPASNQPNFVFALDIFALDDDKNSRYWLNQISVYPMCYWGFTSYGSSIVSIIKIGQSTSDYIRKHVSGVGDDIYTQWPM